MNIKRILLIGLILVAVAASLSIVSADSSVKIAGMDFNIPDGYIENETVATDDVSGSYSTNDGEVPCSLTFRGFEKGDDTLAFLILEFDSPDDAKKAYDYSKDHVNGTTKTINGHDGIYYKKEPFSEFTYIEDKYSITISVKDESLLEKVVPK